MVKTYDNLIKAATARHLPGTDWRLLKAQLCAESRLDPKSTSPAGAMGIAQFMPATWAQLAKERVIPPNASAYSPAPAIHACAFYMARLAKKWTAEREETDRYLLALASYNAGFGNILAAQKKAGGAADYYSIIMQLHHITGRHAQETLNYVPRIFRIWGEYAIEGR